MKRVLITTTSLQDTPGAHQDLIRECGWEVEYARGPLNEAQMLELVGNFDGIICGDDAYTRPVLEKALPRLQFLSKYGIGVDKIDVAAATDLGIPVFFTPGVNHTTVAEHVFTLLLALNRQLIECVEITRGGQWKRPTGHEIMDKTLGIVGLGRIGREVAIRAKAFGMKLVGYDVYWDAEFCEKLGIERAESVEAMLPQVNILTLHCNLTEETREMLNAKTLATLPAGALVINCARGEIVDTQAMLAALESGHLGGYGTDVLDEEPPRADHPLLKNKRCICTPHIGSRTYESVVRQATKAVTNLKLAFEGKEPLAQVNSVPVVK